MPSCQDIGYNLYNLPLGPWFKCRLPEQVWTGVRWNHPIRTKRSACYWHWWQRLAYFAIRKTSLPKPRVAWYTLYPRMHRRTRTTSRKASRASDANRYHFPGLTAWRRTRTGPRVTYARPRGTSGTWSLQRTGNGAASSSEYCPDWLFSSRKYKIIFRNPRPHVARVNTLSGFW